MEKLNPPTGFRFHPTDKQAMEYYLKPKNEDGGLSPRRDFIPEFDVYSCLPDELSRNSQYGKENEFYIFTRRAGKSRKVGRRPFFWRSTGGKKNISIKGTIAEKSDFVLSFKEGSNSKRKDMEWRMREYKLVGQPTSSRGNEKPYVLCKIFRRDKSKGGGVEKENACTSAAMIPSESGSANATSCSTHFSAETTQTSSVISNEGNHRLADYEMQRLQIISSENCAAASSASSFNYNGQQQQEAEIQGLSPGSNWGQLLNQAAPALAPTANASPPLPSCQDQNRYEYFLDTDHQLPDIHSINDSGLDWFADNCFLDTDHQLPDIHSTNDSGLDWFADNYFLDTDPQLPDIHSINDSGLDWFADN